ncbi:MAG: hypothetical protein K2X48_04945 [Chitinophagaceae bacterium]|nr:hypothetical protein [Chitinophagaceae bacterium]
MKLFLMILLGFVGFTSAVCGALMMIEPSGSFLMLDPVWLKHSSFKDYSAPGLILCVVGAANLFAWYRVSGKKTQWLWWALAAGILIIGYELVQMILLQFTYWLQYIYIISGFFIVLTSLQLKHRELI